MHRQTERGGNGSNGTGWGERERYSPFVFLTTREVTRAVRRLKRGAPLMDADGRVRRERILFRLSFYECNQGQDLQFRSATRKVRNEDVRRIENEPISPSLFPRPIRVSHFFLLCLSLFPPFLSVKRDEIPLQEFPLLLPATSRRCPRGKPTRQSHIAYKCPSVH